MAESKKNNLVRPVPSGRISRLARLGVLATTVAGGMLAEGTRRLAKGRIPALSDMLLTPANARRVADELSRLRGAAMKVGQLLSMDSGDIIPPALADVLAHLRSDAVSMPMSQLVRVLEKEWGPDWNMNFSRFTFTPTAAASIGQVHRAVTIDGVDLAVKVQYPGVRESIDSDVDNVAALLRITGLLPSTIDIKSILNEAKLQLHAEADYKTERDWLERYAEILGKEIHFLIPKSYPDLTTKNILVMTWVEGVPVETLVNEPEVLRNRISEQLFELVLKEIFEFGVIQSDPNFANYRFNREVQKLVLLDFGATRAFPNYFSVGYHELMLGALQKNRTKMAEAAASIGYFNNEMTHHQIELVMDLFEMACEPLCHEGLYDFGSSTLAKRMHEAGLSLAMDRDFWHSPPIDALFLHRKLAGIYLLAARLNAKVDVNALARRWLPPKSSVGSRACKVQPV